MQICMQKINLITQLFPKILQRNSKIVILGNFYMPGHTTKMLIAIQRNLWCLSAGKRLSSSFRFSFWYYKNNINIGLGTLGMPGYANPVWYYQLDPMWYYQWVYLQAKNQLYSPCFSTDIAKTCTLLVLCTLDIPGCTNPKS